MKKLLPVLFVLTCLSLTGVAQAHAKLRSSTPANNAQLNDAPTTLLLHFNEDVQLAVLKLVGATQDVPISIDLKAMAAADISVKLPLLAPGIYWVKWSAVSPNDGHVMKGAFSFTVLAPK